MAGKDVSELEMSDSRETVEAMTKGIMDGEAAALQKHQSHLPQ